MPMLRSSDGGLESALTTFERDHVAICAAASEPGVASLRFWRADAEMVSLGRFHRRPATAAGWARRLTGGRALNLGPGIASATMVFPSLSWLDRGRGSPAPEQVLNRALRPWLTVLRERGVDAFYAGRDLVSWDRQPIAAASFTTLPDGVVVIDVHVAAATSFSRCAALLAECDPQSLVPHDASPFRDSASLTERRIRLGETDWLSAIARHLAAGLGAELRLEDPHRSRAAGVDVEPAFDAFQGERGEVRPGWRSALGIEMLGAVEVAARLDSDRIAELELCGDLIAPFSTLEELGRACVGEPPTRVAAERALLSVLGSNGRFLLGVRDFGALVERLA